MHYRLILPAPKLSLIASCGWLLVSLIISGSGQLKALTRLMPSTLAYWTTLRLIRAQYWDEQALLELLVQDTLHTLPPAAAGILHLIGDVMRQEKTGDQQPLAFTCKTGKFALYLFGHSVLLLIAQWDVVALPRTWKLTNGTDLSDLVRHLPKHLYGRVASYRPDGRRRDYWTFRRSAQLSVLGDVTLVLSKRRLMIRRATSNCW